MDVGPAQPSLLRVCKQIRKETTGIYYCENKFTIWIEEHNGAPFTNLSEHTSLHTVMSPAISRS